jgi:hypothetical protein
MGLGFHREKRMLQVLVALAAAVPVAAGAWGVAHGFASEPASLLNHERYLSGLLAAIGLGFWTAIPDIEARAERMRLLSTLVVVGGVSRLLGVAMGDGLAFATVGPLAMELLVTPALCLMQSRLARASGHELPANGLPVGRRWVKKSVTSP